MPFHLLFPWLTPPQRASLSPKLHSPGILQFLPRGSRLSTACELARDANPRASPGVGVPCEMRGAGARLSPPLPNTCSCYVIPVLPNTSLGTELPQKHHGRTTLKSYETETMPRPLRKETHSSDIRCRATVCLDAAPSGDALLSQAVGLSPRPCCKRGITTAEQVFNAMDLLTALHL